MARQEVAEAERQIAQDHDPRARSPAASPCASWSPASTSARRRAVHARRLRPARRPHLPARAGGPRPRAGPARSRITLQGRRDGPLRGPHPPDQPGGGPRDRHGQGDGRGGAGRRPACAPAASSPSTSCARRGPTRCSLPRHAVLRELQERLRLRGRRRQSPQAPGRRSVWRRAIGSRSVRASRPASA